MISDQLKDTLVNQIVKELIGQCKSKVVMSSFSKVKMSSSKGGEEHENGAKDDSKGSG